MAYQKKGFNKIQFIIDKLGEMGPGQVLTVRQPNAGQLAQIRNLLYSYLHHNRLKPMFKIIQPAPDFMLITKKRELEAELIIEGASDKAKMFVLDYLLDVDNEEAALQLIRDGLTKDLWIETISEWRRIVDNSQRPDTTDSISDPV